LTVQDKDKGEESEKWRCECGREYEYKRSLQSHWNRCVLAPLEHPNARRICTKIVRRVTYILPKEKSIKGDKYLKSTFRGYPLSIIRKLSRTGGYGYMRGVDYNDEYFEVKEKTIKISLLIQMKINCKRMFVNHHMLLLNLII
jgi:hypothetical protein